MLRVFALLETDLTKNERKTTGEYCKKSMTSGWRSSLKNFFPWTPHLACSRLQDSGEKSFSKNWEKRPEAGKRQGAAAAPFPKSRESYFRFPRLNTSHYTVWEPGTGYSPLHSWNLSFWTPLFITSTQETQHLVLKKCSQNLCICYLY